MALDTPVENDDASAKEPEKDPIVDGSLSWHLAIAALALVLATVWAAYDEFFARRPWKAFQSAFVPAYREYLTQVEQQQRRKEEHIKADPAYQELAEAYRAVQQEVGPETDRLGRQVALVSRKLEAVTNTLKDARSYTAATIYKAETAATEERKQSLRAQLAAYHEGPFEVELPDGEGGFESRQYDYQQLLAAFDDLQKEKSELRRQLGELVQKVAERKKAMDAYFAKNLDGPTSDRVGGIVASLDDFRRGITAHQIHVQDVGLVDRCEVCHLATRSPIPVDAEGMRKASPHLSESMARAFTSHPRIELSRGDLLEVHDPDLFGCTTCHGGNGRALNSVKQAHGRYKHWLWPMYDKENTDAGCLQCHQDALRLEGAPTLSQGRYLFLRLACWGCHPRDGYDTEGMELREIDLEQRFIQSERARLRKEEDAVYESDDPDLDVRAAVQTIMQKQGQLNTQAEQLAIRKASLERGRKAPAPSLNEIKAKLHKDWLPVWIADPRAFRPTTRMPNFGLTDDQVRAIAAFLWQAAEEKAPPSYPRGDAERGRTVFETRGCLACHTIDGTGGFAADLSREGEKANYGYLVEWIMDPPEWTVMPNFRLTEEESRDVATFLVEQKTDTAYAPVDYLDDKSLFDEGFDLVKHFGCFGCHDIAGTETLSRVGTDLTTEGSKPIERLDFGLFTEEAKRDGWYDHKGFFQRKLSDPRGFDEGKIKLDWHEKLKMPNFGLADKPEDRRALVTFLLGSVDSQLPDFYHHHPTGRAKDIEEGWWVVEKYNCTGCHQIVPGGRPDVWDLRQFQGDGRTKAPPSLVGAGARLESDWLIKFLRNPALSDTQTHRNGVRLYLEMRMPTFALSDEEITKVVRFLNAMSAQPSPYPFEELKPLGEEELADARELFIASECLSCHVTRNDPSEVRPDTNAPSYITGAERLKPRWMRRWLRDPQLIMPGTVMPSNFHEENGRWKVNAVLPDGLLHFPEADHIELLIRYQKFFDEAEAEYLLRRRAEAKRSKD